MKITGWWIEGFGIFHDVEQRGLRDGLTIFFGPNEAGKSTLLAFVRGVLFGFPDGRSADQKYPPLRGGRHGGRLFVEGAGGEWIVERLAGRRPPLKVVGPDGQSAPDADLRQLVGGADDRLFRTVFAFSLSELQSFDSLSSDGIRERIFSAGIAGAGRPAREAIRELDQRAGNLLKLRGQARIPVLVAELATLKEKADKARQAAAGFDRLVSEQDQWAAKVERVGMEVDGLQRQKGRAQLLLDLWPTWHEAQTASARLEALEPIGSFPTDGEVRLATIQQDVRATTASLAELAASCEASQRRRKDLVADERLAALAPEVEELYEGLSLHRSLVQQLPSTRLKQSQAREVLDERLRHLGPGWDEARVDAFDRSIARQEEVRAHHERLARATSARERSEIEHAQAERRGDEARQARDQVTGGAGATAPADEVLDDRLKALRRLRANLAGLSAAEADGGAQDTIVAERERSLRLIEGDLGAEPPAWVGLAVLALTIAGLAATVKFARDGEVVWVALLAGSIACALLTLYFWYRRRSVIRRREQREAEMGPLIAERNDAIAVRDRARRRHAELLEAVASDTALLQMDARPSAQEIEERDAVLQDQMAGRLERRERSARVGDAEARLTAAEAEAQRAADARTAAARDEETAREAWAWWKSQANLPAALSPQGVLDYLDAIRSCQEALQARRAAKAEVVDLANRIGIWEERARAALASLGVEPETSEERLVDQVLVLRRRCVEDRDARQGLAALDIELEEKGARRAALDTTLAAATAALSGLFAEAGASDERSFRRRLEIARERTGQTQIIREAERQIATRIGDDGEAESLRTELATGRVEEWREFLASADTGIADLQRRRDEAIARHRDAERERHAVESSADLAQIDVEREGILTELRSEVGEWRALSLASTLTTDTLQHFERTRQPDVLANASRTFSYITRRRYQRVVQEHDGEGIVVIDSEGGRRAAEDLSRGTAEQLYLCIRFALASEFGRRSEPLPVVMDDVFVNFDAERAEAMAHVVAEFAERHQVLVFTCHEATRDMLRRVLPTAGLVSLAPTEPAAAPAGGSRPARKRPAPPPPTPADTDEPPAETVRDDETLDLFEGLPPGESSESD